MNTGNAIKIFDAGRLKVTRAVPEKHIINFFGLNIIYLHNILPHHICGEYNLMEIIHVIAQHISNESCEQTVIK